MYIAKNSFKNLMRNRGRNLVILLIASFTLTSVTLSFAIQTISKSVIDRYKDSFHVDAVIDFDWEKLQADFPPVETVNDDGSITQESSFELPQIRLEDYPVYADSEYVKHTQYAVFTQFASEELTKVPDNLHANESFINLNGMSMEELKDFFQVATEEEVAEQLGGEEALRQVLDMKSDCAGTLWGYTDLSLLEEFSNGENKLETGRFPQADRECIVSSKYAEQNHLKIGDTMKISGSSKSDTEILTLTITGIYAAYRSEADAVSLGDAYGFVYTTFATVANSGFHWVDVYKVIFELKDPESAKLFEEELYAKGLSEYRFLSFSNAGDEYEKHTEPLKNISHISEIFSVAAGVIGVAILLLITLLGVRERKYEIGVLRAMGMKKTAIARGMFYENLMIMAAAFGFSMAAGLLLTRPVASILLENLEGVNTSLPPVAAAIGAGMAFLLTLLAGLCCVFAVMRHEPMKILSERNG